MVAVGLAFASSLAVAPGALSPWPLAKVLVFAGATLLALSLAPRGRLPRWVTFGVLAAVGVLVIAAAVSPDPVSALLGRWPRYEGIVAVPGYALALIVGARLLGPAASPAERRFVVSCTAVVAAILAVSSILDAVGVDLLAGDLDRTGALLGNATDQGVIAAAWAMIVAGAALSRGAWLARIGLVSAVTTVILSQSRTALAVLVLGLITLAVIHLIGRRARGRASVLGAVALVTVGAALVSPGFASRLLGTSPLSSDTVADRLLIWSESIATWLAVPLLGVGPSGFVDAVAVIHGSDWFTSVGRGTVLDSPHSVALQALLVGGPLLLALLLVVTGALIVAVLRRRRDGHGEWIESLALGAAVIGVALLANPTSPALVVTLAVMAGGAVAVAPTSPTEIARPSRRTLSIAARAATGVWAALVALTLAGEYALGAGARSESSAEADRDFMIAAALRPWDVDTPIIAAQMLADRVDAGDHGAAEPAMRWSAEAVSRAPLSLAAAQAAITTALATGDLALASETTDRLRRALPSDPWIAHRSGVVALLAGDTVEAEAELIAATALDPSWSAPWETLAYLYESQGRTGDAQRAADEALLRR